MPSQSAYDGGVEAPVDHRQGRQQLEELVVGDDSEAD
jgi:hypothetical protein